MSRRPEHLAPPEIFYDESEARKYTQNSRTIDIQEQMCRRAVELLLLSEDETFLLLDIGCGSGLSGSVIEEHGHMWIGIDISSAMLGKYTFSFNTDNRNICYLFLCILNRRNYIYRSSFGKRSGG